jgi:hypothetical protein
LPRGTASGGAGDASIARCETANASTTRVVGRLRRRIGASNPDSSRERDADEPTFRLRTTETLHSTRRRSLQTKRSIATRRVFARRMRRRTLRTLHARVRFTRITTLTDHIFPLLDFHANENIRRVAGGVL